MITCIVANHGRPGLANDSSSSCTLLPSYAILNIRTVWKRRCRIFHRWIKQRHEKRIFALLKGTVVESRLAEPLQQVRLRPHHFLASMEPKTKLLKRSILRPVSTEVCHSMCARSVGELWWSRWSAEPPKIHLNYRILLLGFKIFQSEGPDPPWMALFRVSVLQLLITIQH